MSVHEGDHRVRRRRRDAFMVEKQLDAAALLHERGLSLNEIARRIWKDAGYKSPATCYTSLWRAFHGDGYFVRAHERARGTHQRLVEAGASDMRLCGAERSRGRGQCRKALRAGGTCRWHDHFNPNGDGSANEAVSSSDPASSLDVAVACAKKSTSEARLSAAEEPPVT